MNWIRGIAVDRCDWRPAGRSIAQLISFWSGGKSVEFTTITASILYTTSTIFPVNCGNENDTKMRLSFHDLCLSTIIWFLIDLFFSHFCTFYFFYFFFSLIFCQIGMEIVFTKYCVQWNQNGCFFFVSFVGFIFSIHLQVPVLCIDHAIYSQLWSPQPQCLVQHHCIPVEKWRNWTKLQRHMNIKMAIDLWEKQKNLLEKCFMVIWIKFLFDWINLFESMPFEHLS